MVRERCSAKCSRPSTMLENPCRLSRVRAVLCRAARLWASGDDVLLQARLVAFDQEEVITTAGHNLLTYLLLGKDGVAGEHGTLQRGLLQQLQDVVIGGVAGPPGALNS